MFWYLDLCKELISCPNIIYVISKLNFDIIKLKFKVMRFDNQNIILDVTIYDIDIYLKWYLLWYPSLIFEFFWYSLNINFSLHHWTPHNFILFSCSNCERNEFYKHEHGACCASFNSNNSILCSCPTTFISL